MAVKYRWFGDQNDLREALGIKLAENLMLEVLFP